MKAVIMTVRIPRRVRRSGRKLFSRRFRKSRRSVKRRQAARTRRSVNGMGDSNSNSSFRVSSSTEYELGYQRGLLEGAEKLLESRLPGHIIIPDITPDEAMSAGVQSLSARAQPLLSAEQVFDELEHALSNKQPYSFIRLGDGELMTLAQERVLPVDTVRTSSPFLPYAGIVVPDLAAREIVANSIRLASLVGVPLSRQAHFQPLLFQVFKAHELSCYSLRLTISTMNYTLHEQGLLKRLLTGRKLLLIGNVANELANVLRADGHDVVGIVSPVKGFSHVGKVVEEAVRYDFDLALVSAGVPAVPIVVRLAGMTGKVAIDFGHLADRLTGITPKLRALPSE